MLINDVIEAICEVCPEQDASELSKDTPFDTLAISSLELTEVFLELEERHDVEIDIDAIDAGSKFNTLGDLVGVLENILQAKK